MADGDPPYRIGEAARLSGVPAASIRYYENEGLLPAPGREDNRYRLYGEDDVHVLRFIRLCRALDMSLDEVRALLRLDWNDRDDCAAARETLDAHLGHVRARLLELQALERDLRGLRDRCDGSAGPCGIIHTLHTRADAQPPGLPPPAAPGKRHV
ncbi:Cd(II)/Pb(II)-responsive transcriptional regulator [Xylophilus sp.]|uniref:Cd(II)/Pb(II)-responsive transcriptional regulator n=1 Tax=Xylophilus sp. TaxID=2653893 RepID=UPI0013B746DF|nr:Cd(II)/Pb(II)-responsive transcriptional regulator [Xylophilus sp.]KAF1049108.1 MAG: HTH-type transcriptional regulator ZntR [Xylophilus sp.]